MSKWFYVCNLVENISSFIFKLGGIAVLFGRIVPTKEIFLSSKIHFPLASEMNLSQTSCNFFIKPYMLHNGLKAIPWHCLPEYVVPPQ